MLYAVKIGPIPTDEGRATFYCAFEEEKLHPPVLADSDAEGLRQLAAQAPGAELYCDPGLAKAGQKLGFEPVDAPEWAKASTVAVLTALAAGPHGESLGSPLAVYALAVAAARFRLSAPWTLWSEADALQVSFSGAFKGDFEASLLGNGGAEYGLALYKGKGSVAKVARLLVDGKLEEARRVDSLALVFDDQPPFAVELFERLLGMPAVPVALRLKGGEPKPVREEEALALAAALNAAAAIHPRARGVIGDAGAEGLGKGVVTAILAAPVPAMEPMEVGEAKPEKKKTVAKKKKR